MRLGPEHLKIFVVSFISLRQSSEKLRKSSTSTNYLNGTISENIPKIVGNRNFSIQEGNIEGTGDNLWKYWEMWGCLS